MPGKVCNARQEPTWAISLHALSCAAAASAAWMLGNSNCAQRPPHVTSHARVI